MNAKNLKFLQLFESLVEVDYINDTDHANKSMKAFFDLDYQLAVDVWDYLCTSHENKLSKDDSLSQLLGQQLLESFYAKAPTKCVKAIIDTPSIRRAIYTYCASADSDTAFKILCDLVNGSKYAASEEILKCLVKNEKIAPTYGAMMKKLLESVFVELLKKNSAKIDMNKKLSTFLLTYINKIKTGEKALLEQRIRETQ